MNTAGNRARYFAVLIAVIVSAISTFIVLSVLGAANFIALTAIWWFLLWRYKSANRTPLHWILVGAIFMAIPPVPNYLAISESGKVSLNFIGFGNVFDHPFGIAFFIVFYTAIFYAAFKLFRSIKRDER